MTNPLIGRISSASQRLLKYPLFFGTLRKALPDDALLAEAAAAIQELTTAVDAQASGLSRKALTLLESLGHIWLELLAPQIE